MQEHFSADSNFIPDRNVTITAMMTVPEFIRGISRAELAELAETLPIALAGEDIEGVHKVRVQVRRLRTCLKLGTPYFRKKVIKSLRGELKEVGQIFGQVRDLDVLQLGFRRFYTGEEIHPRFDREIWQPAFGKIYTNARIGMQSCVDSLFFKDLLALMNAFLQPGFGLRSEAKTAPLPTSLRAFLSPTLMAQLTAMLAFRTSAENPPPYAEFHKLRLLAKAHRYTLEFIQPVLQPEPAGKMIENMVIVQDHLGELNDCVVAEKWLKIPQANALPPEVNQALTEYRAYEIARRAALTVSFSQIWADFQNLQPAVLLETAIQGWRTS